MNVRAPFTIEQVEALNAWQTRGDVHPFTCGDALCRADLVATESGWICRRCTYRQDWAHDFMAGSPGGPA